MIDTALQRLAFLSLVPLLAFWSALARAKNRTSREQRQWQHDTASFLVSNLSFRAKTTWLRIRGGLPLFWSAVLVGGAVALVHFEVVQAHRVLVLAFAVTAAIILLARKLIESLVRTILASGDSKSAEQHIARDFVSALLLTFLISLGGTIFLCSVRSHGALVGDQLEQLGYHALRLALREHTEDSPVVVIDTSDVPRIVILPVLPAVGVSGAPLATCTEILTSLTLAKCIVGDPITDRAFLQRFLEMVLSPDNPYRPKAVGIDINFDPHNHVLYSYLFDYAFFERCFQLSSAECPIYLGIHVSPRRSRLDWLSMERWAPLAAEIGVISSDPEMAHQPDLGHLPARVTIEDHNGQVCGEGPLSLGAVLTGYRQALDLEKGHRWLFAVFNEAEEIELTNEETLHQKAFLVDYSWHGSIKSAKLDLIKDYVGASDTEPARKLLDKKVVILGDVRRVEQESNIRDKPDYVSVPSPGRSASIPGVLAHACAAATLAADPISELTPWVRAVADIVLSLSVLLLFLLVMRLLLKAHAPGHDVPESFLQGLFVVVVAIVLISGFVLAGRARVFWPDLLVVILLVSLHVLVEAVRKLVSVLRLAFQTPIIRP